MSKSIRAAVLIATAGSILLPGAAVAAEQGEIGVGVSRSPQPYGTLTICASRADGPASTIKLIRKNKVVKSFKLAGCKLLSAENGLTPGKYRIQHTAPRGYVTTGWMAGGMSGTDDQQVSSVSRSRLRIEPRKAMSTAGFLHEGSSNWVTFTRAR